MKHGYSIAGTVGLLIALILSSCENMTNTAGQKPADRQADEAAIKSLLAANFAASTARDAAGVAATFMPGGDG